jgi:hypothetical protein
MAIAFDSASTSSGQNVASITWSHTVSGTDTILLVGIHETYGVDHVSGVIFNGDALTRVAESLVATGDYLYYIIAPDTGAHDIVVTFSSTFDRSKVVAGVSLTGVHQTDPVGTIAESGGNVAGGNEFTDTVATEDANSWVVDCFCARQGTATTPTIAATAGQTSRVNAAFGTTDPARMGISTKPTTTTGNYSLGWTPNIDVQVDTILAEIKASIATTNTTNFFQFI